MTELNKNNKTNFTVMTLIAYYDMVCKNHAIKQIDYFKGDDAAWEALVHKKATEIMDSGDIFVRECVQIDKFGNILVVLDKPSVTTSVIEEAQWVFHSSEMSENGAVEFGESKTYASNEVSEHMEMFIVLGEKSTPKICVSKDIKFTVH